MATGTFSVGGLATGMDTQSIIDKLVDLESFPLKTLRKQQDAFNAQISVLGDLISRFDAVKAAANDLAWNGAVACQTSSANTAFTAVPGNGASAGSYSVHVASLATAAKWRSSAFTAGAPLQTGTLRITVDGKVYPPTDTPPPDGTPPVTVGDSTTLQSLAAAIRATGAPVAVDVLTNGTDQYLSITSTATGFAQADDISLQFTPEGATAQPDPAWSASFTQRAKNAEFDVDGLSFTRPSNVVSDAIPGTTLTLRATGGAAETLTIGTDVSATQARVQEYVDAYNGLISAVQKQLAVTKDTDRTTTLAGDSTVRGLQQALQAIGSVTATPGGAVHTLADIGVSTQRDGSLTIDARRLAAAVARDPVAVNAVFGEDATGIGARVSDVAWRYTNFATGLLTSREKSLQGQIASLDDRAATLQSQIDGYRQRLVDQFSAMEDAVSSLKSIGNYLTALDSANSKK